MKQDTEQNATAAEKLVVLIYLAHLVHKSTTINYDDEIVRFQINHIANSVIPTIIPHHVDTIIENMAFAKLHNISFV